MNILIINGSPRKKGLISQMLSIMQEEAEKHGDTVEMVYTNDLTVKPCTGCMACRKKEKCVLAEDDSQRVLKMRQQAEERKRQEEERARKEAEEKAKAAAAAENKEGV